MATPTPSYAVVWRKDGGPIVSGQLRLEPEGVRLVGAAQGRPEEHLLAYGALAHVRLGWGTGACPVTLPPGGALLLRLDR